jgi:carboxyl-terminal processing protease
VGGKTELAAEETGEAIFKVNKPSGMATVRAMIKRIISIGSGLVLGLLAAHGAFAVASAWGFLPGRDTERAADRVREVMRLVGKNYVDPAGPDAERLQRAAINGIIAELDPFSEYLSQGEHRRLKDDLDSRFGGIGVQVELVDNRLTVVAPIAGTPGERAGILRGDQIVRVDDLVLTPAMSLTDAVANLRGPAGTTVRLGLHRPPQAAEIDLRVTREIIRVDSVRDAALLPGGVGYVRIAQFAEDTGEAFARVTDDLRRQGARALVIDLRNNPGGLLDAAMLVAERWFQPGELVVYTQGRGSKERTELRAEKSAGAGALAGLPTAVLVNGGSASASEIVAGALRDTGRAVIVGEKTFGKGSVQSIFEFKDESALRLTVARYYTPSGVTIHEVGILPDIEVKLTPEQEKAVFLARLRPDITDPVEFKAKFGVELTEDTQLNAARQALAERVAAVAN